MNKPACGYEKAVFIQDTAYGVFGTDGMEKDHKAALRNVEVLIRVFVIMPSKNRASSDLVRIDLLDIVGKKLSKYASIVRMLKFRL